MRLLLDQGLPGSAVWQLKHGGFLAEHVGNLGLAAATDAAILEVARQQNATVGILAAPVCRTGWLVEVEGMAVIDANNPALPRY